jgi:hypothetical protein
MSATGALNTLGSDLAFSVSFNIASQLLDAANELFLSEEELVAIVLAVSVILGAIPSSFRALRRELIGMFKVKPVGEVAQGEAGANVGGIMDFASLLISMAQRISISICVQLLSSNVTTRQPLRSVRIVSLLAISVFFLFLESTSDVRNR